MNYLEMEKKWRKKWADTKLYSFDKDDLDNKLYCLEMFSYPSGARLHVGHWYNYGPADTYARFKKQQGYNVFHPMGFDAFGLPAENYAIKTGVHPKDSTEENMTVMMEQLKSIGSTIDWDYTLRTNSTEYYKWTQWLFLQLYKHNLAYRAEAPVNWCPSCNTVLANEQVVDGGCERCHSTVQRRNLTQWFFRITAYADELLDYLPKLDWPERIKAMQTNWIGRSEGAELTFQIEGGESFKVFTTRPDTLMGCTYCVFAPEHPMVDGFTSPEQRQAVEDYRLQAATASEIDRLSTTREKTGVFTGGYALHPITGQRIPIWVADYALYSYGTGAVMAVPGHDDRDFEFADKFGLPIVRVISGGELPYVGGGKLVNSGRFDGLDWEDAKQAIVDSLGDSGRMMINYRMRDWLISRQRYWGAPIPIIHCEKCGAVPVPEQQLPVELPYDVEFMPDGTSPLLKHEGFMNVKCPQCGGDAKRDADTMDTFVCSSWYFLRHPDNTNGGQAFDMDLINKMLPVDVYIGGAEHAVMHLLYARFFVKALRDMGMLDFDEPFTKLVNQGVILGVDGEKMSKSRGNVVSPDDYIGDYGSDIFRMYLMFGFNYVDGGAWNDDGIKSLARYLERVERLVEYVAGLQASPVLDANGTACVNPQSRPRDGQDAPVLEQQLRYVLANTIQRVTEDADRFMFNTSIARLMELTNALYKYRDGGGADTQLMADATHQMVIMLAPFAPHFAEEMNERLGMAYSVINHPWPEFRPQDLVLDVVEIAVQVNGKLRARLEIPSDTDEDGVKQAVLADDRIQAALSGKDIKKVIVVKGKLVNIVAK